MRAIDGDRLKRKAQKVATEAWKMKIKASVETILNEFVDWINEAPTIKPEPHWIPCSERLPDEEVLCCDTRGEMIIGYPYQDEESNTGFSAELDDVFMVDCAAWMPLPKPYRAERRTDEVQRL